MSQALRIAVIAALQSAYTKHGKFSRGSEPGQRAAPDLCSSRRSHATLFADPAAPPLVAAGQREIGPRETQRTGRSPVRSINT
jgi:hypothetical protein